MRNAQDLVIDERKLPLDVNLDHASIAKSSARFGRPTGLAKVVQSLGVLAAVSFPSCDRERPDGGHSSIFGSYSYEGYQYKARINYLNEFYEQLPSKSAEDIENPESKALAIDVKRFIESSKFESWEIEPIISFDGWCRCSCTLKIDFSGTEHEVVVEYSLLASGLSYFRDMPEHPFIPEEITVRNLANYDSLTFKCNPDGRGDENAFVASLLEPLGVKLNGELQQIMEDANNSKEVMEQHVARLKEAWSGSSADEIAKKFANSDKNEVIEELGDNFRVVYRRNVVGAFRGEVLTESYSARLEFFNRRYQDVQYSQGWQSLPDDAPVYQFVKSAIENSDSAQWKFEGSGNKFSPLGRHDIIGEISLSDNDVEKIRVRNNESRRSESVSVFFRNGGQLNLPTSLSDQRLTNLVEILLEKVEPTRQTEDAKLERAMDETVANFVGGTLNEPLANNIRGYDGSQIIAFEVDGTEFRIGRNGQGALLGRFTASYWIKATRIVDGIKYEVTKAIDDDDDLKETIDRKIAAW